MPWFHIIWDDENEAHIAEHGISVEDVENTLADPIAEHISRTSGRLMFEGEAVDGRIIMVVYEDIDGVTIYPITA